MSQATTADRRDVIETVARKPPDVIRAVVEDKFVLASDILTYNWITGNARTDWPGKSFDWYPTPPHYSHWHEQLEARPLNMLLAARKHTKTTFACCLMIHRSEFIGGHAGLYWANTEGQVKERMEELDEIIEANRDWLEHCHTDTALLRKEFYNGSRIRTTWVQGAAEGGHVDLSLGDDPMKEFADIPDSRIEEWYGKVVVPMLNPDGLHAIIGTRKRPNDLYELLRSKHEQDEALADLPNYTLTEYPAIREAWEAEYDRPQNLAPAELYTPIDAPELANVLQCSTTDPHIVEGDSTTDGESASSDSTTLSILWPEARPVEWLAKNLGGQGTPYFLREFCMVFTQAEDAIVQRDWIRATAKNRQPPTTLSELFTPIDYPDAVTREAWDEVVVGIDPAGKGRDRFGFVTVGQLTHPAEAVPGATEPVTLRHILDVWQAQDVPPSQFRAKMTALYDRYQPTTIALESNLNQTWVADDEELPRRVRTAIEPIATGRAKHSWKDGVPRIGSDIEAGHYRFYLAGEDNQTDALITALTSIQMHEGELVGHTPDLVMALYMAHKELTDPSGDLSVSRTNLKHGQVDAEQERKARETKATLRESDIGRAILETQRDREGYYR